MQSLFRLGSVTLASAMLLVAWGCQTPSKEEASKAPLSGEALLKRGEYLVLIMGCDDCHSPKIFTEMGPEPDQSRRLSGHPADLSFGDVDARIINEGKYIFNGHLTAAAGPWGISFSANLTPDDTGLGSWTEMQFLKAIRDGKWKGLDGSRELLPPMPWFNYRHMEESDLKAIFAYLKTLKPVKNLVPMAQPPTWNSATPAG